MKRRTFLVAIAAWLTAGRELLASNIVEVEHDIDARGVDPSKIKAIVEGLPYLELPWNSLRFIRLDVSGQDNMVLESEFFFGEDDAEQELQVAAYIYQYGVERDIPVKVIGLSDEDITAKCVLAEVFEPYDTMPSNWQPALYRMHLEYLGETA